jgi:hypothetical protein
MFGLTPLETLLRTSTPAVASAFSAMQQAGQSASTLWNDHIASGTPITSQFTQAYSLYITDEEALLNALNTLAAGPSGAPAWVSSEISDLRGATQSDVNSLYTNGGSIGSLSLGSALSGIPGASSNSGLAGDPLLQSIASIFPALASALANPSTFAAVFSGGVNMSAGPGITQSGYLNTAGGTNIGQGGIGNSAFGNSIEQAGDLNSGLGSWLDALGTNNTQSGTNDLAVGNYNQEYGSSDVTNGNRNTLSGSNDVALGDNNTIIGDSARVFGSDLSASAGQTVFGTASNFTVINTDGTWSTVVNGSTTVGSCALTNSSLMAAESAAIGSAEGTAQTNYTGLSSQLAALGWSQVVSSIGADVGSGAFGGWNFAPSAAVTGISSADMIKLGINSQTLENLSAFVASNASNSVLGEDALAAYQLISAGINPSQAIAQYVDDQLNPAIASGATSLSGVSAQDRANAMIAQAEFAAGNWSALNATLSALATSSNPNGIAVEANLILSYGGGAFTSGGLTALSDLTQGIPIPSALLSSLGEIW